MAGIDASGVLDAVRSHLHASGWFDEIYGFEPVNPGAGHEPTNIPGSGLTAASWVDRIEPHRAGSGLAATSVQLIVNVRIYRAATTSPRDHIEVEMLDAADDILAAYTGDFTLGGLVRNVNVLGEEGIALRAQAGWLEEDEVLYRVYTLTVPLILSDTYPQVA